MNKVEINVRAFKKSLFSSLSRLIGVVLAGGAGSVVRHLMGPSIDNWGTAILMAIIGFVAMWISEYERENIL